MSKNIVKEKEHLTDSLEFRSKMLYRILTDTGLAEHVYKKNYCDWGRCFTEIGRVIEILSPYLTDLGYDEQFQDGLRYYTKP